MNHIQMEKMVLVRFFLLNKTGLTVVAPAQRMQAVEGFSVEACKDDGHEDCYHFQSIAVDAKE